MIQTLLPLLPEPTRFALILAIVGSLVGAGLWLAGARFSRVLIPLLAVSLGAGVGMALPDWMAWTIQPMASAVAVAILMGFSAYTMHKLWVGLGLGLVLATWATLAVWVLCSGDATWTWPAATESWSAYLSAVWAQLPFDVQRYLPFAAGVAMISGLSATLLWPQAGVVLLYSSGGASLLLGMGVTALEYGRPDWMSVIPGDTWAQLVTFAALVAFGAVLQWQLQPDTPTGEPPEASKKSKDKS